MDKPRFAPLLYDALLLRTDMNVYLENVRCFAKRQYFPLRPLTILVGENSTGKSTFLAMLAYLSNADYPGVRPNFNVPPFDLGTYDSIATYKGGRYGRSDHFSIGFREDDNQEREFNATYVSHRGQPQLRSLLISGKLGELSLELGSDLVGKLAITIPPEPRQEISLDLSSGVDTGFVAALFDTLGRAASQSASGFKVPQFPKLLGGAINLISRGVDPVIALAPIRTKPRRTYDELSDAFTPEGDHIPILLARLWEEENSKEKERLSEALYSFGVQASLFKRVGARRLGNRPTDPFQLLVTTAGPPVNLADVGYGVSQSLPLVVQSVLAPRARRILVQQPEVHLHPRGQAALGSFFAHAVSKERKKIVIETHSDYLVDRVRLEVAQGNLASKDVVIFFFEKDGIQAEVHKINVDETGNVVNAPASYRRFFFEEEISLLSRVKG